MRIKLAFGVPIQGGDFNLGYPRFGGSAFPIQEPAAFFPAIRQCHLRQWLNLTNLPLVRLYGIS